MTGERVTVFASRLNRASLFKSMTLKSQLKYFLKANGMTASQLAKAAKVPKQSIGGWMAGSNPRDVRQVKKVADVFETTIDNLMFGSGAAVENETAAELKTLLGDDWIGGCFEVRFRRIKK